MTAVSGDVPADDDRWAFEPKWDGMRAIVEVAGGVVRARSRTDKDLGPSFPELAGVADLCDDAVFDGEIVAFDDSGRPSFGRLQQRLGLVGDRVTARSAEVAVVYVIFDLLRFGDLDVAPLPYEQRRSLLEQLVEPGPTCQLSPSHRGDGAAWLESAREQRLEGLVAKRLGSTYQPGRRSQDWRKIKIRHAQEFAVCGWTPGTGRRSAVLGALVLGCHDGVTLRWAGNVGTGFTDADLAWWRAEVDDSASDRCPFDPVPSHLALREARWVIPREVVQVAFGEWTGDHRLRHPVLLGRRPDVDVGQVRCDE